MTLRGTEEAPAEERGAAIALFAASDATTQSLVAQVKGREQEIARLCSVNNMTRVVSVRSQWCVWVCLTGIAL